MTSFTESILILLKSKTLSQASTSVMMLCSGLKPAMGLEPEATAGARSWSHCWGSSTEPPLGLKHGATAGAPAWSNCWGSSLELPLGLRHSAFARPASLKLWFAESVEPKKLLRNSLQLWFWWRSAQGLYFSRASFHPISVHCRISVMQWSLINTWLSLRLSKALGPWPSPVCFHLNPVHFRMRRFVHDESILEQGAFNWIDLCICL